MNKILRSVSLVASMMCGLTSIAQSGTYHFMPANAVKSWSGANATATVYSHQSASSNTSTWNQYWFSDTGEDNYTPVLAQLDMDFSSIGQQVSKVLIAANGGKQLAGDFVLNCSSGNVSTVSANASDVIVLDDIAEGTTSAFAYILPSAQGSNVTFTATLADGTMVCSTDGSSWTATHPSTWMSTVASKTLFSHITIPGTHDAATSKVSTSSAKTQALTVEEQLNAGVRAFDFRPRYNDTGKDDSKIQLDNLEIYHGMIGTGVKFKDAMNTIVDFLKQNPSETVLVYIQKEDCTNPLNFFSKYNDYSSTWRTSIRTWLEQNRNYVKSQITANMTLGDCRGKMVVLSRNPYGSENVYEDIVYGGRIAWDDNTTGMNTQINHTWQNKMVDATVEDWYNSSKTADKLNYIKTNLDKAAADNSARWFITYTSLANNPANYAKTINPEVTASLANYSTRLGAVFMDYAGSEAQGGVALLNGLIEQNQKYAAPSTTASSKTYDSYEVTVGSDDEETGSVSIAGTLFGKAAKQVPVTLTATPADGYEFDSWSDGNTENPRTLAPESDTELKAHFTQIIPIIAEL